MSTCTFIARGHPVLIAALLALAALLPARGVIANEGSNASKSCTRSTTLTEHVDFATIDQAAKALEKADAWARQLSAFDLGVRQRTALPTSRQDFLDFAAANAMPWAPRERDAWQVLVDRLSWAMAGLDIRVPKIDLVTTTGQEEFGAAYTRGRTIVIPSRLASLAIDAPDNAFFLLAHELFHVLSRGDSELRHDMHGLLGFTRFRRFEYPAEFEGGRVSNPDSFDYSDALNVQAGGRGVDVVPIIQSRVSLAEAIQLPDFFMALGIDLLAVDIVTGKVIGDGNGNVVKYGFDNTNWVPLMLRNSDFIIQPEEVIADNFALLMEWRASGILPAGTPSGFPINDIELLVSVENRLRGGCAPTF